MLKVYDFLWFRAIRVFCRRTWKKLEFPHTLETYKSPPSLPIAVSCCCLYSKLTRNSHFVTDALESTTSTIPFNQGTSGKSQAESCLAEINLDDTVWLSLVGCVLRLKGIRMSLISLVGMGNQRSCLCTKEKDVFGTSILVWVPITHQQTSEACKTIGNWWQKSHVLDMPGETFQKTEPMKKTLPIPKATTNFQHLSLLNMPSEGENSSAFNNGLSVGSHCTRNCITKRPAKARGEAPI